jgi:hypothetical protein
LASRQSDHVDDAASFGSAAACLTAAPIATAIATATTISSGLPSQRSGLMPQRSAAADRTLNWCVGRVTAGGRL